MTLLEQVMALRDAGATHVTVSHDAIHATFVAQPVADEPVTPTRESVRLQEARALLDAEAEERP